MKDTIKIYTGSDDTQPLVVYIVGISKWSEDEEDPLYLCRQLNSGIGFFAKSNDLIPFENLKQFEILLLEWEIQNCDRIKEKCKNKLKKVMFP